MRRSALTKGTPGSSAATPERTTHLGRATVRVGAWLPPLLLLLLTAASASPQWTATDDFEDRGFRNPDDGTPLDGLQYDGDVTPEDYVIDQITAYLQRAQSRQPASSSRRGGEEEAGGVLEDEGPPPAREGHGRGFTYRFPERAEQGGSFAVNPSDPKYYTAAAAMGESEEARERWPVRPLGRFPVVKPIRVVSTSGTEMPPIQDVDSEVPEARDDDDDEQQQHRAAPRDSDPAEQVKRERPAKVPLVFGSETYLTAIISGCIAAGVVGVIAFAIFWYRFQRKAKAAADVEYPAYGVTGPNQEAAAAAAASAVSPASGGSTSPLTAGDRRLAQSAQMYHYQHQKQQIIAMESSRASSERRGSVSEVDSEEENEEGDYTVYECPGLAPTGEMEVKNPLFHDDPTPSGGSNGRDQRGDGGSKP